MKRITPEEVVAAYKKTGQDPHKRFVLRALAGAIGWDDPWEYADRILGPEYGVGLLHGFKGEERCRRLRGDPKYDKGYADGHAAAVVLFPEFPPADVEKSK